MKRLLGFAGLSLFALAACAIDPSTEDQAPGYEEEEITDLAGTAADKAIMPVQGFAAPVQNAAGANGITYNGGPIMTGTVNVYLIWYGNWAGKAAKTIIPDLVNNLSGSGYTNINTTYTNSSGTKASNSYALKGQRDDNYSNGTTTQKKKLSDQTIANIVSSHIGSGKFPSDANGIYFLITSDDVTASSGFCTQYCGWHTYGTLGTTNIKYSFLGDPNRCPSSCEGTVAPAKSPNGDNAADALVSIFAHELEEAQSDPQLNAWYDASGYENADKCAWTWGTTYTSANGGKANMKIGTRDYLIQRNWVNANGGSCATSY